MVNELEEDPAPLVRDIEEYADMILDVTGPQMFRLPTGFIDGLASYLASKGYIHADSRHVADFSMDSFGLQHPAACRPDLLSCPVNRAFNALESSPVDDYGRYVVALDDDGVLVVGERIQ